MSSRSLGTSESLESFRQVSFFVGSFVYDLVHRDLALSLGRRLFSSQVKMMSIIMI